MKETIRELAERYEAEMLELRRQLHRRPELSMKETETTRLVENKCLEYGLVKAGVNLESGAAFILNPEKTEKSIIFRADPP